MSYVNKLGLRFYYGLWVFRFGHCCDICISETGFSFQWLLAFVLMQTFFFCLLINEIED